MRAHVDQPRELWGKVRRMVTCLACPRRFLQVRSDIVYCSALCGRRARCASAAVQRARRCATVAS